MRLPPAQSRRAIVRSIERFPDRIAAREVSGAPVVFLNQGTVINKSRRVGGLAEAYILAIKRWPHRDCADGQERLGLIAVIGCGDFDDEGFAALALCKEF